MTFEPAAYFTRAQIVTMLWKLQGQPYVNYAMSFKDVKEGEWYSEAVRWAAAEKIVNGNDKNEFMPDEIITREMLATVIYQYAEQLGHGFHGAWVFLLSYADRADIAEWADTGVHYAAVHQLFNIEDGAKFEPQAQVTRAEAAYAFYQLIKPVEE